jgi:RNA polymerase sigma factor (TIGR02999 family)
MTGSPDQPAAFAAAVYDELRKLARHYMRGERSGHTLQTTALVNEAYVRLAGADGIEIVDRTHFFAMAATMMRRILVDHARAHAADKRGGGVTMIALDERIAAAETNVDLLALDAALTRLAVMDPQQARIVELRFFTGLTVEETADALDISPATVKRDWAIAKAWLHHELGRP